MLNIGKYYLVNKMGQKPSLLEIEESFNKNRMRFRNLHQIFGLKSKYVFHGNNSLYLLDPTTKQIIPIKFITVFGTAITRSKYKDVIEVIHCNKKKYYSIIKDLKIQDGCIFKEKKDVVFMIKLSIV
jgi:hypothetical protein